MDNVTERLIQQMTFELGLLKAQNIELQVNLDLKNEELESLKMNRGIEAIKLNENMTEVPQHESMEN
nr:MAG TPA: hypothetical protein [Caudoviricetes sp.]DAU82571.1 MAG TPA: hypothetical protein [Caudoviricetes sp.]